MNDRNADEPDLGRRRIAPALVEKSARQRETIGCQKIRATLEEITFLGSSCVAIAGQDGRTAANRLEDHGVRNRTRPDKDLWDAATEHIGQRPEVSLDALEQNGILRNNGLVSQVPTSAALHRLDIPAAVFDEAGAFLSGSEGFPDRIDPAKGRTTWTGVDQDGVFLIFHRVVLDLRDRVMCLRIDRESLHRLLPGTTALTRTEFSVLCGLLNGRTVRDMATSDGVAHNTRRRQVEAVLEKLGVNSQTEAVRLTFVTVIDRLLAAIGSADENGSGVTELEQLHGGGVRFHRIHLVDGAPMRVAEYGDPTGDPVLLFHPMLFPCGIATTEARRLAHSGFRVIVPFRPGFFDTETRPGLSGAEAMLADWADHCNALLEFLNLSDVRVASVSFAVPWAVEFVRRHPRCVKELALISATQPSNLWHGDTAKASFIHAAASIAARAPWLAEPMARLHAVGLANADRLQAGFRKSMWNSPADLADIDRLSRDAGTFDGVVLAIRDSTEGMARDLLVMRHPWETYLASMDVPVRFVHGGADRTSPVEVVSDLAESVRGARLYVLEDRGHLFSLLGLDDALEIGKAP